MCGFYLVHQKKVYRGGRDTVKVEICRISAFYTI